MIDYSRTGDIHIPRIIKDYSFDKYKIKVVVDSLGRFLGIESIALDKSFLESRHKKASSYDVSEYYTE